MTYVGDAHDELPPCVEGTGLPAFLHIEEVNLPIVATSGYELQGRQLKHDSVRTGILPSKCTQTFPLCSLMEREKDICTSSWGVSGPNRLFMMGRQEGKFSSTCSHKKALDD